MATSEPKEYKKLLGTVDYDHDAAEELAEALNEITTLEQRIGMLKGLVNENEDLHQFVWRTAEGRVIALHKLEDDHLVNIMLHLLRRGEAINKGIRSEAVSRGLTVPQVVPIDWDEPAPRRVGSGERADII